MEQQRRKEDENLKPLANVLRMPEEEGNLNITEYDKNTHATNEKMLLKLFEKTLINFNYNVDVLGNFNYKIDANFFNASAMLEGLDYTIKDIELLVPIIERTYKNANIVFNYSIGIFVSAAINRIIKETDTINLDFTSMKVNYLGLYLPCGNLIIHGNVGDYTGSEMKGGNITICGNAGNNTGEHMRGGSIIVDGNAGDATGYSMHSGSITIHGNAGNNTGNGMENGSLTVGGNAGDFTGSCMQNGSITIQYNAGDYTGMCLMGGSIMVVGNVNNYTGEQMDNGSITGGGNAGDYTGGYMKNGNIKVGGSAGKETGEESYGGEINVDGEINGVGAHTRAKIIYKGKLLNRSQVLLMGIRSILHNWFA